MSAFSRTSISLPPDTLRKGQERAKILGYASFSDYLAFLISRDATERPAHTTVREESGMRYTTATPLQVHPISEAGQSLKLYSHLESKVAETPINESMEERLAAELALKFVEQTENPPATPPPEQHTRV